MFSGAELHSHYERCRREGERMAGGLNDLAQRAAVYHHLFEHSGRNHAFPVIAAHGALWARGYFRFGMRLGWWLSWKDAADLRVRRFRLEQLAAFADAFREVNRRVCAETYASYHFTARFGEHPEASEFVTPTLLEALNRAHAARRAGRELPNVEKRALFEAFFLNEQETVVGPSIQAAVAAFDWPLMRFLALKPLIRFAYFPAFRPFWFADFANREERIEKGLRAFDIAAAAGWDEVQNSLRDYDILPDAFFAGSARHFRALREQVLAVDDEHSGAHSVAPTRFLDPVELDV
jgi:hypothetical protein